MSVFSSIKINEASGALDSICLEAVEQAQFVYCYHARLMNVTNADVCHTVVQVSGAADQDERIHFWGRMVMWKKTDI